MGRKVVPELSFEYLVVDEELSEEYSTIYLGPDEKLARELYRQWWNNRSSVKLKRRRVSAFEIIAGTEPRILP